MGAPIYVLCNMYLHVMGIVSTSILCGSSKKISSTKHIKWGLLSRYVNTFKNRYAHYFSIYRWISRIQFQKG